MLSVIDRFSITHIFESLLSKDTERYIPVFHECKDRRINLRKILETTGFEILHCSEREKSYVFKNSEIMKSNSYIIYIYIYIIKKKKFEQTKTSNDENIEY